MRSGKGITIIELLVVLVAASIMLIGVNAISRIGHRSHRRILDEASIYNDISYLFKIMQSRVHRSKIQTNGTDLIAGSEKFGVYVHSGGRDLMYYPNRYNEAMNQVIFSVPNPGMLNVLYTGNIAAGDIQVTLVGEKNDVAFNMSTDVRSRRY